jgi:hypothetical protein
MGVASSGPQYIDIVRRRTLENVERLLKVVGARKVLCAH